MLVVPSELEVTKYAPSEEGAEQVVLLSEKVSVLRKPGQPPRVRVAQCEVTDPTSLLREIGESIKVIDDMTSVSYSSHVDFQNALPVFPLFPGERVETFLDFFRVMKRSPLSTPPVSGDRVLLRLSETTWEICVARVSDEGIPFLCGVSMVYPVQSDSTVLIGFQGINL